MIARGSHRLLLPFVERFSERDFKQKDFFQSHTWLAELAGYGADKNNRTQQFMHQSRQVDGVPLQVIELTGEPGDAVLCHPSIIHAKSPNYSDRPRFMRVKAVVAKRPLD